MEALAAKLGLEVVLAILKRYWKPLLFGAIGLGIVATIAVQHWRINALTAARAQDQAAISAAVKANQSNIDTIRQLNRQGEIDRKVTAEAIRNTATLATRTETAIQEIQSDPNAAAPAGPLFDRLGERLRELDQSRH